MGEIICQRCGATGSLEYYESVCCGYANPDGECCGNPIQQSTQEQCPDCEGSGILKKKDE